ncbi:glycosyltransferase family 2 protein [Ruania suaedae]|uniref:glycosyltransferase family 2 protein n=1 Tax=Ruania suaedae TaxID=2897774 RepID=UPI001E456047|nr:glycosyltransferase family 2 protein [Ruania suaedae]UFU02383.1 glycosyltransferase family 2 protein [Ruania suaedae]
MIDCVLVIVSYRSASDLDALLATVPAAAGTLSWRAVVVNNDPDDDLRPILAGRPEAELIEAGANLGYAGGINRGLAAAPASRWIVFLNPDLRLGPGALESLAMATGGRDAVVPAIEDEDGRIQYSLRREPTILGSLGEALLGDRWPSRPRALSEMVRTRAAYERPGTVDWATGAVMLVPTAVVARVGPWDADRFFLYSEETDYCRRLRTAGASIRFLPEAVVSHRGGGSGTSDALHALQEVNRTRYFGKWHGRAAAAAFTAVAVLSNVLRCHRPRNRAALRALLSPAARAALPGGPR